MNKGTIFKYELRRLLFSKEYLLLLTAAIVYSVSLLRSMVMFGTNFTAPFSQWTFSSYCSTLTPLLYVLLLVLCVRQFKASERGAEAIIGATPMPIHIFKLLRASTIICAYIIPVILSVIICFAYYAFVFDYTDFGPLAWLCALIILPSSLLLLGISLCLGEKKQAAVYVLLGAVLIIGVFNVSLPSAIDLIGKSLILPLYDGAKNFELLFSYIIGRVVFLVLGVILIAVSLRLKKLQQSRG